MTRSIRMWTWIGRGVFLLVLASTVTYLVMVGLDRADKVGSAAGIVVALGALGSPYLLRPSSTPGPGAAVSVDASGSGTVAIGGDSGGEIRTRVAAQSPPESTAVAPVAWIRAVGAGSVAIGGDNTAPITTDVHNGYGK